MANRHLETERISHQQAAAAVGYLVNPCSPEEASFCRFRTGGSLNPDLPHCRLDEAQLYVSAWKVLIAKC